MHACAKRALHRRVALAFLLDHVDISTPFCGESKKKIKNVSMASSDFRPRPPSALLP